MALHRTWLARGTDSVNSNANEVKTNRRWSMTGRIIGSSLASRAGAGGGFAFGFAQFVEGGFEASGELVGWGGAPVVKEEDGWLRVFYVLVDGDHVEAMGAQGLQDGGDFGV